MASWVSIGNAALNKVGSQPITSLTEASKRARLVNSRIKDVLRIVLESHFWNCAKKDVVLSPLVSTPVFKWGYSFQLPVDFLRVKEIHGERPYAIQGQLLLSNDQVINLTYIQNITDPSVLDAQVAEAVALYLAKDICVNLTADQAMRDDLDKQYGLLVNKAKAIDSQDNYPEALQVDTLTDARFGYSGYTRKE